jgi:hypothetical protein
MERKGSITSSTGLGDATRRGAATNGAAAGLMGGYRDWRDLYSQNFFSQDAGQQAVREHEDPISLYHALRPHADGMFNAKTGRLRRDLDRLPHEARTGLCRGPR